MLQRQGNVMLMTEPRKVKLVDEEFKNFKEFFECEKLARFNGEMLKQVVYKKMQYFEEMADKYGFDVKKARLYSDGVIEIDK